MGVLPFETIDGDPAIAQDEDTSVITVCGVGILSGEPTRVEWIHPESDSQEFRAAIAHLKAVVVPDDESPIDFGPPERTVAVVTRVQGPAGVATVVFRHPGLTHERAVLTLQKVYLGIEPKAPASTGN
jgi:hypothetical protein